MMFYAYTTSIWNPTITKLEMTSGSGASGTAGVVGEYSDISEGLAGPFIAAMLDIKIRIDFLGDAWKKIVDFGLDIANAAKKYFESAKDAILKLGDQLSDALSKIFKPTSFTNGVCAIFP